MSENLNKQFSPVRIVEDLTAAKTLDVFDSSKEKEPNFINPGDTVVFKKISMKEYKSYNG